MPFLCDADDGCALRRVVVLCLNTGRERTVSPSLLPHLFDIAAFTTFLSCFAKPTVKSSKAAKRFNAVRKAEVSWKRIRPMMKRPEPLEELRIPQSADVTIKALSFSCEDACDCSADYNSDCNTNYNKEAIFSGLSVSARPGDIVGVTGPVACGGVPVLRDFSMTVKRGEQVTLVGRTGAGKSTIFRLLLGLYAPKEGSITIGGGILDRERNMPPIHFFAAKSAVFEEIMRDKH